MSNEDTQLTHHHPQASIHAHLRAAPLVGLIVISYGHLDTIMREMLINARVIEALATSKPTPDLNLPSKSRDRLNEWLRRYLGEKGQEKQRNLFREQFNAVKSVRDNLAHNLHAIEYGSDGKLRFLVIGDEKAKSEMQKTWKNFSEREFQKTGKFITFHNLDVYHQNDILKCSNDIKNLLTELDEIRTAIT